MTNVERDLSSQEIDYRYLNMDTEKFVDSQAELAKQIGKGAIIICIPNPKYGQILIAGGEREYSERECVFLCRKLSGMFRNNASDNFNYQKNAKTNNRLANE